MIGGFDPQGYVFAALFLLVCAMNIALLNNWVPGRKLKIHKALWYGDNEKKAEDKTDIVVGWIRPDNSIHHEVHEDQLGRNPIGQTKRLRVLYSLGKIKNRPIIVTNGETLIIPEPS